METKFFTATELAERWGVSYRAILNLIKSGKLKAFKPGREYRITTSAVEAFELGPPEYDGSCVTAYRDKNIPLKIF